MSRVLRSLHLNVQTAKTKILDEARGEITSALIDPRVETLTSILDQIDVKEQQGNLTPEVRKSYLKLVDGIARRPSPHGQVLGAQRPLEGLGLRTFKRWLTCHTRLGSHSAVSRLLAEVERNPDYRLTQRLVYFARRFPRKSSLETRLVQFMQSERCIFPHQRGECFRALRYLSRVSDVTTEYARRVLYNPSREAYERVQAANLLSRTELAYQSLQRLARLIAEESDPYVQTAIAGLLVQKRHGNGAIVRMLVFHPNNRVHEIGRLFRSIKNDEGVARSKLRHIFREEVKWVVCDNMPFLHLMANSQQREILELLARELAEHGPRHFYMGIREILTRLLTRTKAKIAAAAASQSN